MNIRPNSIIPSNMKDLSVSNQIEILSYISNDTDTQFLQKFSYFQKFLPELFDLSIPQLSNFIPNYLYKWVVINSSNRYMISPSNVLHLEDILYFYSRGIDRLILSPNEIAKIREKHTLITQELQNLKTTLALVYDSSNISAYLPSQLIPQSSQNSNIQQNNLIRSTSNSRSDSSDSYENTFTIFPSLRRKRRRSPEIIGSYSTTSHFCTICQDVAVNPHSVVNDLGCDHVFCFSCLLELVVQNNQRFICPCCRINISQRFSRWKKR